MIDRCTGRILLSDRENARGVDLAENIAAKAALQSAAHELCVRVLRYLAEHVASKPAEIE